jgi:choline kinase
VSGQITTGVILAAGAGTRFNGGGLQPKCLARFGDEPLIARQLRALRTCGFDRIVVVVGFAADQVRGACGDGVEFIENPTFEETNSLYSLWLAREVLPQGFVVMNCDVLFPAVMLRKLVTTSAPNALLVSYRQPGDPAFGEEEMKVQVRNGRVVAIAKDLPLHDADGENVGIGKFSAPGAQRLTALLDDIVGSGHLRDWAPRAFGAFARERALSAVATQGLPWIEIDTAEDYRLAVAQIFAAVRDADEDLEHAQVGAA